MDPFKAIQEGFLKNAPVYFKMGALFFLVLILLIPIGMVESLISERQDRQQEATSWIGDIWGREQNFFGPVLIIPYERTVESVDKDGGKKTYKLDGRVFYLPELLTVSATAQPEVRRRGIFESIVYTAETSFSGGFAPPDLAFPESDGVEVFWDRAIMAVGVSDMRGANGRLELQFGGSVMDFAPGGVSNPVGNGIHAQVGEILSSGWPEGETIPFSFSIRVAGSGTLAFTPAAKLTKVTISSPWPHPSFGGAWLPGSYTTGPDGFEAHWDVSFYGRDFPQQWTDDETHRLNIAANIERSRFGVSLISPVGFYQKSARTVKYATLFVLLVFATIFILEVAVPVRVHFFHYALVGFAMAVFYLLLLALSEIIGFAGAYGLAALTATGMISLFLGKIMRSWLRGVMVAAILTLVYGFLYVILQLEDYALLTGTLSVAVVLAAVMYVTRNIDWYRLTHAEPNGGQAGKEAA